MDETSASVGINMSLEILFYLGLLLIQLILWTFEVSL